MERVIAGIDTLLLQKPYLVIAIDGRCASGKSTMANGLLCHYGQSAALFHMDDFFLPPGMKTAKRLEQPGGNVHHERFLNEVLEPLKGGEPFDYRRYNCQTDTYESVQVQRRQVNIVEGVYAMHPSLDPYYDLRVFMTLDTIDQRTRLMARGGPEKMRRFIEEWIPLEEIYFRHFGIRGLCDLVIRSA